MKQLLAFIIFLFTNLYVSGQDTLTPECKPGRFYAITSVGAVYAYTITGNSVTLDGRLIAPAANRMPASLAIATLNSSRRFYATDNFGVLFEYNNKWDTIYSNSSQVFANLGGNGKYLYGHHGDPNRFFVDIFSGGTFTNIVNQPGFSVADVAVDSVGQVYFFGRINADTALLQIATPAGNIVASYKIKLDSFNGYGCFLMGNVLYVGYGEQNPKYPNSLVPVTITATSATIGNPIPMPVIPSATFYDLASCGNFQAASCSNPLKLTLSASPNPVRSGDPVNLVVTGNIAFTVTSWQPASLFPDQTSTIQNTIITAPTTITVTGTTAGGCYDTATIVLSIAGVEDVWVPNAFTPDNNRNNDVFYVYGNSISRLDLTIWNKWGEKVFATQNKSAGWDGTYKGKVQPMGAYIYVARIVLTNGKEVMKTGAVNLLR